MDVLFMGTPDFSVLALESLIKEHNVKAVITQPDKPKGRGKKILFTHVKEKAIEHNIPVYQPKTLKDDDFIEKLKEINADIFVVAAYGQLLPETVLKMPKYGCINIHASLLPEYRGAAPIQRAIIDGKTKTGVTIMYMEKKLDSGDMLLKQEIEITPNDTYGSLHDKMSVVGASLIIKTLKLLSEGNLKAEKQDSSLSTYAYMIDKETGHIKWDKTSDEIINLIRGLNPSPCAYTNYCGETFKIYAAEKTKTDKNSDFGEIISVSPKKGFVVKTADSAIIITQMQAKGGKKMSAADYLRGHEIKEGIILQ